MLYDERTRARALRSFFGVPKASAAGCGTCEIVVVATLRAGTMGHPSGNCLLFNCLAGNLTYDRNKLEGGKLHVTYFLLAVGENCVGIEADALHLTKKTCHFAVRDARNLPGKIGFLNAALILVTFFVAVFRFRAAVQADSKITARFMSR